MFVLVVKKQKLQKPVSKNNYISKIHGKCNERFGLTWIDAVFCTSLNLTSNLLSLKS